MIRPAIRVLGLLALLVVSLRAQGSNPGPDVIVGSLPNTSSWGSLGNISAFSLGTTSCNIGDQNLNWYSNVNQHPVIAQNLYRIKDDRFEMIGLSQLKHGFTALTGSVCDPCQNPGTGSQLGVGCSDPYSSGLNGSQNRLGPRYEVDAFTGAYPYPFTNNPYSTNIDRRLQVANADLDPALNVGALYFVEGHYVTPDDASAGNHFNNASYRPTNVAPNGSSYDLNLTGSTIREKPAIEAWPVVDPQVSLTVVNVPGEGRFYVAVKRVDLGGGMSRYNYALHNLNSDRSARGFSVAVSGHTVIQNLWFHDVNYHSGEPTMGTDWPGVVNAGGPTWSTDTYAQNMNANAVRWGSCYSFGYDTDGVAGDVTIDLFKPGTPTSITATICPPSPQIPPAQGTYAINASAPYDMVPIPFGSVGPTGDDTAVTANLGFSFAFFGTSVTQLQISSNGYLTLVGNNATVFSNQSMPNGSSPNGIIAGYWDDLNPNASGQIRYQTVGASPTQRFVVHYDNVRRYANTQTVDFQIILDQNGDISFTYIDAGPAGSSATIGLEDPVGALAFQHSYNTGGSIATGQTIFMDYAGSVPHSADLTIIGDASPFSYFGFRVHSVPYAPLLLVADLSPGPVDLGNYGIIDIGFSAFAQPIADGTGYFGPPNPSHITDICGFYEAGLMIGAATLPTGYTFHTQGFVLDLNAPNGLFHLTNPVTFVKN